MAWAVRFRRNSASESPRLPRRLSARSSVALNGARQHWAQLGLWRRTLRRLGSDPVTFNAPRTEAGSGAGRPLWVGFGPPLRLS